MYVKKINVVVKPFRRNTEWLVDAYVYTKYSYTYIHINVGTSVCSCSKNTQKEK